MVKKINLDAEFAKMPIYDYPKVKNTPKGYPSLIGMQGRTWYERAVNYETKYGKKVKPIKGESING